MDMRKGGEINNLILKSGLLLVFGFASIQSSFAIHNAYIDIPLPFMSDKNILLAMFSSQTLLWIVIFLLVILGFIIFQLKRKYSKRLLKAEKQLENSKESLEFYQIILDNAVESVLVLNVKDLTFIYINDAFTKLVGWERNELLGRSLQEIRPDLDSGNWELNLGFSTVLEDSFITKDDQTIPVELSVNILEYKGENSLIIFSRDIRDRRKNENEIKLINQRLQLAVDATAMGIWDWDLESNTTSWNDQMFQFYGTPKVISMPYEKWEKYVYPGDIEIVREWLALIINRKNADILEFRIVKENKSIRYISANAMAVDDENGKVVRIIGTNRDITISKAVEEELLNAKERAELATRAKTEFLSNMSHEIRTPMNAILGHSQILQRDKNLIISHRRSINSINKSGEHLLTLINDILDLSKIEAGKISIEPVTFRLRNLIREISEMFEYKLDKKSLKFQHYIEENVPDILYVDKKRIRQILINLVGNALKFTLMGEIKIHIYIKDSKLQIKISDTGIGIPKDKYETIFESFEQTLEGKLNSDGTGLGLTISRQISRLMGGDIKVESIIGKGTDFLFSFQFEEGNLEHLNLIVKQVLKIKDVQQEKRILIIDDIIENREVLRLLLEPVGFTTHYGVNGIEAIKLAESWNPDVILMDVVMSEMGGVEATKIIKSKPWGKNIKIIAVSASALDEERINILNQGADSFIKKPVKESELFNEIGILTHIEYEYDEENVDNLGSDKENFNLENIPSEVIDKLKKAVVIGDIDKLRDLIVELEVFNMNAALYLNRLVDDFELEQLINLLNE